MNTQPPTPLTDAQPQYFDSDGGMYLAEGVNHGKGDWISVAFARTLELENIELKEQVKMLRGALQPMIHGTHWIDDAMIERAKQALAATNPNKDVKQVSPKGRW
jgi:hypothetical protein